MNLLKSERRMSKAGAKHACKMAVLDSIQLITWRTFSDQRVIKNSGEEEESKMEREK